MSPRFSTTFIVRSLGLIALATTVFLPECALAQATMDLRDEAKQVANQTAIVPQAVAMLSYVVGVIFAFRGLLALRRFIDNADEHPVVRAIGYLAVASLLISLPYVINTSYRTLGVQAGTVKSSSASFCDKGFGTTNGAC